jgi:hypothetical protein
MPVPNGSTAGHFALPFLAHHAGATPCQRLAFWRDVAKLFLALLVHLLGPAPLAILFELDFALNELLVFAGPVVSALALAAGELYQSFLGHAREYTLMIR